MALVVLHTKIASIFPQIHNSATTSSPFTTILKSLDTLVDIKPMNLSLVIIGGHAFNHIFVDTSMDVKRANARNFIKKNHMLPYIRTRYQPRPGNISRLTLSDHYQNPTVL